jgi:hypothetical protein
MVEGIFAIIICPILYIKWNFVVRGRIFTSPQQTNSSETVYRAGT